MQASIEKILGWMFMNDHQKKKKKRNGPPGEQLPLISLLGLWQNWSVAAIDYWKYLWEHRELDHGHHSFDHGSAKQSITSLLLLQPPPLRRINKVTGAWTLFQRKLIFLWRCFLAETSKYRKIDCALLHLPNLKHMFLIVRNKFIYRNIALKESGRWF